MALRPVHFFAAAVLLVAGTMAVAWVLGTLQEGKEDQEPFRMTLLVSGTDANGTDLNLTDARLWVAVVIGGPRPKWSVVDVRIENGTRNDTLVPPRLMIEDVDGNGRVSEGDLLTLNALTPDMASGTVTLLREGRAIGTVSL